MRISNESMQSSLVKADERRFYYFCHDISLAGENYKLRKIDFFVKDASNPTDDFVCVKEYRDSFAIIYICTEDCQLVSEGIDFLLGSDNISEYLLVTDCDSVLRMPCITDRFEVADEDEESNPTYSIGSPSELIYIPAGDGVTISLFTDDMKPLLKDELSKDDFESWIFNKSDCFKDTRIYILRADKKLAGYLRAECGYKNYYDIGWLQVLPQMRNRGYASMLVSYFSNDCKNNNLIPNYSFAVCPESERVAEKCGFSRDKMYRYRRPLTLKR